MQFANNEEAIASIKTTKIIISEKDAKEAIAMYLKAMYGIKVQGVSISLDKKLDQPITVEFSGAIAPLVRSEELEELFQSQKSNVKSQM